MVKVFIHKNRFFIILFLIFVLLRLPSLFEPYWYGDEGIYLVLGQAIRRGLVLYTQIHDNKPPTLYYLAALAQTVFGFRLLLALFMAGAYYYFYLLSNKLLSSKLSQVSCFLFLVLTSIPLIEGNIANAEVFMLLPTIAGIYYFLYSHSSFKFLVSGLLLGFAFTIKIPVVVEFGFLGLWLLINNKNNIYSTLKNLFFFSLGFIFPFTLYFIYFYFKGALSDFVFASILQNFGYLSSWQTGTHSGTATNSGLIIRAVTLLVFWGTTYYLYLKKYLTKNTYLILFWFSATIFGALLSARPYPHYLIQVTPPLCLLILAIFDSKLHPKIRYFILFLCFVFCVLIFRFKFYAYPVFSYYKNYYSHLTSLSSRSYRNYFGSRVDDTYQISQYLKDNTSPNDKIFVWADEPYIYALSSRLPVGRFTVAYHIVDFNQYLPTYNQLIVDFPKVIVTFPMNNRPYPELERLLKLYYHPDASIGDSTIYFRTD
ncbi:MAG: hypothetical protein WAV41_01315 [Microgenomates group bacterium]